MRAVSPLLQRFPFVGVLVWAVAGIVLADVCGRNAGLLILFCVALGGLLLIFRGKGVCWAATLACFALLHWWAWNDAPARSLADRLDARPFDYSVRGLVCGEPKISSSGSVSFPLKVASIKSEDGPPFSSESPVIMQVRWEGPQLSYGDEVAFSCKAGRAPPARNPGAMDYRGWLERKGIFTQLSIDPSTPGTIIASGKGNPVIAAALRSRSTMRGILSLGLAGAPDVVTAISGICLGVTEGAPEGFLEGFRFTGTMHLFAVSGLHVGMIAVILWFALSIFRLPRVWAVAIIIPALFFYVLVTGMKMGSVRSAVMSSFLLLGLAMLRRSPLLNTLAAAAFLQLALDTNALFSAGWQFSYSVVAAIILAAPVIERRAAGLHAPDPFLPPRLLTPSERARFAAWRHLLGLAAVSTAAWIGALIPTLVYFHLVSFSALGANLLAVPLAFAVLSLGVLALMTGLVSPWVAGAFNNANWLVVKVLIAVVQGSTLLPGGHWFAGPPGPSWPEVTILDLRGAPSSVVRSGNRFSLVDAGSRREALSTIIPCLETYGVNSLGMVLVTRADAARLGGMDPILRQYRVGTLDLPAGEGRSPYARRAYHGTGETIRPSPGECIPMVPDCSAEVVDGNPQADFLVMRLDLGCLRILYLPGISDRLLNSLSNVASDRLRADIVVAPLGGVPLSPGLELIRRIAPAVVVSPVLPFRQGGTPVAEWESLLSAEKIAYLRMNRTGAVIVGADPQGPFVRSWIGGAKVPVTPRYPGTPLPH